MKVKRIDVFDYRIILTPEEFNKIKTKAEVDNTSIEIVLEVLFELLLDRLFDSSE